MLQWTCKKFDDLTPAELYAILQLRNEVFVVEQNCVYQDADNKDPQSFHLMGWQETGSGGSKLVAYTRLIPPAVAYPEPSIGRVVSSPSVRGTGTGRMLMQQSIEQVRQLFGNSPIRIGAQLYLLAFYTSLGFQPTGEEYLEDNIPHIEMILPPQ
jgi:ElaA protein